VLTAGLYCTVGCHPCSAYEFEEDPAAYLESLIEIISEDQALPIADRRVVAIGECGLGALFYLLPDQVKELTPSSCVSKDYDRLSLCSKEIQLRHFPTQLALATRFQLPLFLHCRHPEAHIDFVKIIKEYNRATELSGQAKLRGVVHSHSGSYEEALEMIELGFMIGINGCSLKTDANLECVRALPLSSLLVESDCPYCDIRPSHSSHTFLSSLPPHLSALYLPKSVKKERWRAGDFTVKGRNEPCHTGAIAWVVSRLKEVELQVVADQVWKNTTELFGLPDEVEEVVLPGSELSDKVNGEEELASIEG
jgi:TatD DNase family protein